MSDLTERSEEETPGLVVVQIRKKQKRKNVKRLKRGRGPLMERIAEELADLKGEGALQEGAQTVVVVIREKPKKRKLKAIDPFKPFKL